MCGDELDARRTAFVDDVGGSGRRACGVDHVVDDDAMAALDITDHLECRHLVADVGATALVDECDRGIQLVGVLGGELDPARVR